MVERKNDDDWVSAGVETGPTSRKRRRHRQAKSIVCLSDPSRGPYLSHSQTFDEWASGDRKDSYSKCVRFIASALLSLHMFSQQSKYQTWCHIKRDAGLTRANQVHLSLLPPLLSLQLRVWIPAHYPRSDLVSAWQCQGLFCPRQVCQLQGQHGRHRQLQLAESHTLDQQNKRDG